MCLVNNQGGGGIEQQRAALQITAQDDCLTGLCQLCWRTNKNEPFPFSEDAVFLKGDNKCKAVQSLAGGNVKSISLHLHNIISSALMIRLGEAVWNLWSMEMSRSRPQRACCTFPSLTPGGWHPWRPSSSPELKSSRAGTVSSPGSSTISKNHTTVKSACLTSSCPLKNKTKT